MAHPDVLQLGPWDRLMAGVQLAGLIATWLLMYLPVCALALAGALRDAVRRRA